MKNRIEFREPLMHPNNFCFSVSPDNPKFGDVVFDINDQEITIFTDFDHHHYETYIYDDKDEDTKRQKAIQLALTSIKELISGEIVIGLEKKGEKIIKAFRYYKDNPEDKMSAVISLDNEGEKLESNQNVPTERVTVNWNGILKKEELLAPTIPISKRADSDKQNYNTFKKLWSKLTGK
ncbi:hypothetical protein [Algoriphagus winogradskyi]|uniref:Phage protein n=1 Tax=Algoriphagus winogradskyi TaxID=237017 RepID=A0ABY1P8N0_9BACT|nr:hypothetical protein [Algoriphagus winogradskyi]SMP28508.1 hypothetical protein SAMN06265367_1066 [Algoriphagus winogradskyi]